jgi:hypothetical protein
MEGKKYNLEKASTEATKLQKKVSSGVALNYTEAENQLTEEELKQKIILHLKRSDIERAIGLLQKNINYRDNILSSSEVKELIYDRYKWLLSKKNDTQAKKLESFIQLTPEEQLKIKITDLLNALKTEKFDPKSLEGLNITDLEKHDSLVQAQVIENL